MKQIVDDIQNWLRNPLKWHYFTYIFRRPFYKLRLLYRISKIYYYGAWEIVDPILEITFETFCEFYERCDIKNHYVIDIDNTPKDYGQKDFAIYQNNCYKQMDEVYHWYKIIRHERQEELDYLLELWSTHHVSWWDRSSDCDSSYKQYYTAPKNKYAEYLHKLLMEEENKFEQEKEDNFIKLIKLRNRLWN